MLFRLFRHEARPLLRYAAMAALLMAAFFVLHIAVSHFFAAPDVGATTREQNALANGISG